MFKQNKSKSKASDAQIAAMIQTRADKSFLSASHVIVVTDSVKSLNVKNLMKNFADLRLVRCARQIVVVVIFFSFFHHRRDRCPPSGAFKQPEGRDLTRSPLLLPGGEQGTRPLGVPSPRQLGYPSPWPASCGRKLKG